MTSSSYKRGDIILVDIAFSGVVGYKCRLAVIISANKYNTAGIKVIVAAITSNISPPFRPGDYILKDWTSAGLLKPSAVRGVLATVDKSDIVRKLGVLSTPDLATVEQSLANILGFEAHV